MQPIMGGGRGLLWIGVPCPGEQPLLLLTRYLQLRRFIAEGRRSPNGAITDNTSTAKAGFHPRMYFAAAAVVRGRRVA